VAIPQPANNHINMKQAALALGAPRCLGELDRDDESVTVLGQDVALVAELGLLALDLGQACVGVGARAVGGVASPSAGKVDARAASGRRRIVVTSLDRVQAR
jgi:hypothetical protein